MTITSSDITGSHSCSSAEDYEDVYIDGEEHVYEEIFISSTNELKNDQENELHDSKKNKPKVKKKKSQNKKTNEKETNNNEIPFPRMEISRPSGSSYRVHYIDSAQVKESGLLDKLDASQIALQEAKYEIITSEASYFKSLVILEGMFMKNPVLIDETGLSKEDRIVLFTTVEKVKQCSERFLTILLDGWEQDLMLGYLCQAVFNFVESGAFLCYVVCCGNQTQMDKTLEHLMLTNPMFAEKLSELEKDPICQMFSLRSFLTLPMQRITRLPLLVQAILRRLPENHSEYDTWKAILVELQEIVYQCNEAANTDHKWIMQKEKQVSRSNNKGPTVNTDHSADTKRKLATFWDVLKMRKQKVS